MGMSHKPREMSETTKLNIWANSMLATLDGTPWSQTLSGMQIAMMHQIHPQCDQVSASSYASMT